MLSAGNRVEVLVKAGAPGTYDLDPDAQLEPASRDAGDVTDDMPRTRPSSISAGAR